MKLKRYLLLSIALLCSMTLSAQSSQVKWQTKVEHISGDSYKVLFSATIEKGWHMYDMQVYNGGPNSTVFTFEPGAGLKLDGKVASIEKPIRHHDEMFDMEIGYYENKVTFVQKVKLTADKATLKANVEWMVCDDKNCAPPVDEDFTIEIVGVAKPADSGTAAVAANSQNNTTETQPAVVAEEPEMVEPADVTDVENPEETVAEAPAAEESNNAETVAETPEKEGGSIWAVIIEAILWGFAALLTPCVFPMVPMTVSFFMKDGGSPARGRFRASMYGFFIVALYTVPIALLILITTIVGGESVTTDIFNWLATHWLPNIIFFIVFMIFAASFFGAFEIRMPSKLVNKADGNSEKNGLGGIFFMALTLVLVSFSCTGPIVGNVIIKSVQGEIWQPIVTMLAFSIAFALPFTIFAFFPAMLNKMPKSGGWMNSVKVVIGFLELALGLKFLSTADQAYGWGLLDREVYLAMWIVIFTLMGVYLLGKIKFSHDSDVKYIGVGRLLMAILSFTFVVYMIPGMWGAPLKAISGYLPPMDTQDFVLGSNTGSATTASSGTADNGKLLTVDGKAPKYSDRDRFHFPHGLQGFFVMDEAVAYANKVNKPIMIDFTGKACTNCREMEARVWSDPEVLRILKEEYVLCAIYMDDKQELPEEEWVVTESGKVLKTLAKINSDYAFREYDVAMMPYYVLVDSDGKPMGGVSRALGYNLDVKAYIKFLEDGVAAFKALK